MTKLLESLLFSMLSKIIEHLEPGLEALLIQEVKDLGYKLLGHCENELANREKS